MPSFQSALATMGGRGPLISGALGSMLELLGQKPFLTLNVSGLAWGSENPIVQLGNDALPADERLPFDKFGFFVKVR